MKKLIFALSCMVFPFATVFAQTPQPIQAGFTAERELGAAEKHNYEVNLNKGELLNLVVEQRGVDLVLRVYAPDGKLFDRMDSPNGREGDEPLKIISTTGGRYRIEVSHFYEPDPAGKYFVKTVEIRKPTGAETKTARLKDELMKIVVEDTRVDAYPNALKRRYVNTALVTHENGSYISAAELIDLTTKTPPKMPEGFVFEDELTEARVVDFGDVATLSVRQNYSYKNASKNINRKTIQRIGYVFKRTNGEWRIINVQRTLMDPELSNFIKLDAKQLESLVGVYGSEKTPEQFTVTLESDRLFGSFPNGNKFELTPETESVFRSGTFTIAFIRGADGAATQAVLHFPMPDDRMLVQSKVK